MVSTGSSHAPFRRLSSLTALTILAVLVTAAPRPALASDPMTFEQVIGRPRHVAPEGVAVDPSTGDVYVAEPNTIGNVTNDRVVKYDANGTFLDVVAVPGSGQGQVYDPTSVAVAPGGDVYVTDKGNDRVVYFDDLGNYINTWGGTGSGNGQFLNPEGIAIDSVGDVYVADTSNGRIQKFDSAGGYITAWSVPSVREISVDASDVLSAVDGSNVLRFSTSGASLGSWAASGSTGVANDAGGNVWVTSAGHLTEYDSTGTLLNTYATQGTGNGQLSATAQGVDIAPNGAVYVADAGNGRVERFSSTGTYETAWGKYPGAGVEDAPTGLAVDTAGDVFVTNKGQDLIQEFDASGNYVGAFGGSGNTDGLLNDASALAVDASGNVYVADTVNQRIQVFDSGGNYVRQWGSFGTADGQMNGPEGIAVDGSGHVYVADTQNDRIQEFTTNGTFVRTWGSLGTGDGQFNLPKGIAIDGSGNVWAVDTGNNRVQEFTPTGTFVTKWGSSGSGDGAFSAPTDLAFDAEGTVWVSDKGHNRIQRFSTSGGFLSRLGSQGLDIGQFGGPTGLAIDPDGRLLVADTANNRIQAFADHNGPDTTVTSGPGTTSNSSDASFAFTANEPGATFQCKLDAGAYAPCSSPKGYTGLPPGPHTFYVFATDSLNNAGNQTTYPWTIDTTAPTVTITSTPPLQTTSASASFSFSASEPSSYQCKLDTGVYASCTSPKSYTVINGIHTFKVQATDLAGNVGQAASYTWTMDNTPPKVSITSSPSGIVVSTNASFSFTSPDDTATFECHIDGFAYAPCSSPKGYSGLGGGLHTFYVRATDPLGNVGSPASKSWTVDASNHRPDAQIATGTTYVGNDIYNTDGTNQTKTRKAAVGKTAAFKVRIENDGNDSDPYLVLGTKSGSGYTVSYFAGSTNVTSQVDAGTYKVTLAPGKSVVLTLKVYVTTSAKASKTVSVKVSSTHDPTKVDVVKAATKRS